MSHYYKDGYIMLSHKQVFRDVDCDLSGIKELLDDLKNFNESVASEVIFTDQELAELRLNFARAASALTNCSEILEKKL